MILVTGATGHLGKATILSLLEKGVTGSEIAILVRDKNKAAEWKDKGIEVRVGDYNRPDSLKEGLAGIDTLLLISSSDVSMDRFLQHKQAIDAARENGVKHIIYTGIDIKSFTETVVPYVSQVHKDTSDYLKESGITYTILNNNLYADLVPAFSGEQVLEKGIFFPAGEGKVPFVPRTEMAAAAAAVLTTSGHGNKEYAIAADTAYSFADVADMLSEITGKEVKYLNPDKDSYIDESEQAGIPKEAVAFTAGFAEAIGRDEFDTHHSDLAFLLERKPMDLKTFLQSIYGK